MTIDEIPDVSIVIVNWNTKRLLLECIQSVVESSDMKVPEVVVVDNASTDGSVDAVQSQFPWVRVVQNISNLGFAAACNQGIRSTSGEFILLLNSDAQVEPRTVPRMATFLRQHDSVGVVGGKLVNSDGSFQASFADFPTLWSELLLLSGLARWVLPPSFPSHPEEPSGRARQADWVGGALMMVRRASVNVTGLLDEGFFMYSEEMEWCFRFRKSGWQIYYLPDAVASHRSGGSSARAPERRRAQIYRSKLRFFWKHHGTGTATLFRDALWLCSLTKFAVWHTASFLPLPSDRRRASENAASYRYLLADLAGAHHGAQSAR